MNLRLLARRNRTIGIAPAGLIVLVLLGVAPAPSHEEVAHATAPTANALVVLYDASLGTTPSQQGWFYQSGGAPETFADGATTLDTTANKSISSGYFASQAGFFGSTAPVPVLDRASGYTLTFAVQVQQEDHTGSDKNGDTVGDRAGFSLIVLSSDKKGVELGFWEDQIWIQNDGAAEPPTGTLFTHGEGATYNTTTGPIHYTLSIQGGTYQLSSGCATILRGNIRDYTAFNGPPYTTSNFVFFGDDTTSASGRMRIALMQVATGTGAIPDSCLYLPLLKQ